MVRSGGIVKILELNMNKGSGYQMWAAETPRDPNSVKQ